MRYPKDLVPGLPLSCACRFPGLLHLGTPADSLLAQFKLSETILASPEKDEERTRTLKLE